MSAALPQPSKDSDWTTETLRQYMVEVLAARDVAARERDRRYQERYDEQKEALRAAFESQAAAIAAALQSQKEAAATLAASNNQRLETMNEFRGTVQDVLSGAMPRAEAEARMNAILEKFSDYAQSAEAARSAIIASVVAVDRRVLGSEQHDAGQTASRRNLIAIAGLVIALLSVLVVVVGIYAASR